MVIEEIQIYGYGKLENIHISKFNQFTVFFGENEAGKSTIMSFIHSILFGFPTKVQSELRYEPKAGGKYGGKVILQTEDRGRIVVERVRGKASGDVTVFLEDGTIGEEELLKKLLLHMDKSLFQAVFSFNLQGLQNVHQLNKDDLGKFLFSTGSIGSDRLVSIEALLQKELDGRFKPSGKKPLINEKLNEMKQVHSELKKAELKNEGYWRLLLERDRLIEEISMLAHEETQTLLELQKLNEWSKLEPVAKEHEYMQNILNDNQDIYFPVNGIGRLEKLIQWMKPLEAQYKRIEGKIFDLQEEISLIEPDLDFLAKETDINDALESLPLLEALKEEKRGLQFQLDQILKQKAEMIDKLHLPLTDNDFSTLDTSMFMKERVSLAQKKQWKLQEKKEELDELSEREGESLKNLEDKIVDFQTSLLPPHEREELEKKIKHNNTDAIQNDLYHIKRSNDALIALQRESKNNSNKTAFQTIFLSILALTLAVFGFVHADRLVLFFGIALFVFVLFNVFYTKKSQNRSEIKFRIDELSSLERELTEKINPVDNESCQQLIDQLQNEKKKEKELHLLQLQWEQQNSQFEKIISGFKNWEKDFAENEKEIELLGETLSLPREISKAFLLEAFELLDHIKSVIREQRSIELQIERKTEAIQKISYRVEELGKRFVGQVKENLPIAMELRERLREEQQKSIVFHEKKGKLHETMEELEKVRSELMEYELEQTELFKLARVENEEDFRSVGEEKKKRLEIEKKVEELQKQIDFSSMQEEEIKEFLQIQQIDHTIMEKKAKLEENHQKRKQAQQLLSDTKHQITVLEEGGLYSDLLHKYTQLKAELDFEARQWAQFALAKELLQRTVKVFNEEKLPAILTKAGEYLEHLTEGNYVRMAYKEAGSGFHIHRKDDTVFEANELSQATMEQVYVALRLALVTTIYKKHPFPLIIDDSFVNFDHKRTYRVLELLKKLNNNQVLFFTCHRHLLGSFPNENIIMLESIPVPQ